MRFVLAHLARIGGMIVAPRRTLQRLTETKQGTVFEVLVYMVLVAVIVSPIEAGRALLMARTSIGESAMILVTLVADRMGAAIGGLLGAAVVLSIIERVRKKTVLGFDRALDVASYLLVPHLLLCIAGFMLSAYGLELWWMPHRRIVGSAEIVLLRVAVAFGWSLVLFGWLAVRIARSP
jgi:hypothetical protein